MPPSSASYTIEIIPADHGWILETIANAIKTVADRRGSEFQVSIMAQPSGVADLVLFLPESAYRPVEHSLAVTYLAHKEDHSGAARLFEEVARASDACVTSSRRYKAVLERDGAKRVFTIPLGVDTRAFTPQLMIGVVGRTYETGRKGEHLLGPVMGLPYVKFIFTGAGWPYPSRYCDNADLVSLYQQLDYLLVPSLIEGGPVPLLEALACGCPVIAPTDVGLVETFPHIPFTRGDGEDLKRVVESLLQEKLRLRNCVLALDWDVFGQRHLDLFAKLIDEARLSRRLENPQARDRAYSASLAPGALSIALVTHGAEATSLGGPTIRVRALAEHLSNCGMQVTVLHNLLPEPPARRYDIVHVFNSWPLETAIQTLLRARQAGRCMIFSPIALDLANLPVYMGLLKEAFGRRDSKALGHWLRALISSTPPRSYGADGLEPLEGVPGHFGALQRCAALADHLIFLSEHERRFLASIGVDVSNGTLIVNAVDDHAFDNPDADAFRRRFGLGRYVLCVGRLEYRKNQALLALAMRQVDVTLVLIGGDGDIDYRQWIQRCAGANVLILDRIEDRALLASAYAGADAFVFPSWVEGAPLVAIEAGLVGTPLILSAMSSEREYFGEFAHYVHPADIDAIACTVSDCLRNPESSGRRAQRAAFCRERYAFGRHAQATLSAYRAALSSLRRDSAVRRAAPLIMDVSALIHFLMVEKPFTGVPTVEFNVLRGLLKRDIAVKTVVFFGPERGFQEVAVGDLFDFDKRRFVAKYYSGPQPERRVSHFQVTWPTESAESFPALPMLQRFSLRKRFAVVLKYGLRRVPKPLLNRLTAAARKIRPDFDPYAVDPAHNFLPHWKAAIRKSMGRLAKAAGTADPRCLPDVPAVLHLRERGLPPGEAIPAGARLLTLGQGWLSNEALLDELVRVVQERQIVLEPYVYDLSYHTGGHFSGWTDNDQRFGRLLKLLRYSSRVYTECRQVESELQKLKVARGLSFATVRTGLTVRDMPPASAAGLPPLARQSFIFYVSSFTKRKNHDFLVSVWRELHETYLASARPDVTLLLIGEIQEEHHYGDPAFVRELEKIGIKVLNEVSDPALTWLYENCLFTVYPSLMEGWGIPVQESLVKGKVCLASVEVPVTQEIQNAALIKLRPHDFYGWYEALRTWISSDRLRAAFEEEARRYRAPVWDDIALAFLSSQPSGAAVERSENEGHGEEARQVIAAGR
jgi:glycosyltransferase involved in cell wall biosynthesis